uniref:Immunoglobulin domain-containing protein n=1 Tax=Gouania willdenowi TaxID=441366 RepID=A0A8C5GLB6_GOUWI
VTDYVLSYLTLVKVSGYQGDNVTLHLGAEPSWTLEHIEWYIFTNNTWIATYRNKIPNTGWRPQYRGRLSLDTHTGDLTIHNLRSEDALEYTAYVLNTLREDVVRKIKVTVKQPPLTPSIQTVTNMSVSGRCLLVMLCSSLDEDVELSWDSEPPAQGFYRGNHGGPGVSVFLLMFINSTYDSARVNCSSSTTTDNIRKSSSQVIRPTCAGKNILFISNQPTTHNL